MIKAEIIADSRNEFGNRLTTMVVTFPRYILAEFNTHRMLSKNSASSRAIPFEKLIKSVQETPFIPMAWQKNHSGMQGTEYLGQRDTDVCISAWLQAKYLAVQQALHIAERGATKQLVNRLLEPFMYHTCIVSGTEWENFFALRCPQYYVPNTTAGEPFHNLWYRSWKDLIEALSNTTEGNYEGSLEDAKRLDTVQRLKYNKGMADIHMMALAEAMWNAYNESTPKLLKAGEWHIPYEDKIKDLFGITQYDLVELGNSKEPLGVPLPVKVSTMMNARVSYTTIGEEGGEWSLNKYLQKHDALIAQKPIHASPLEHCAPAMSQDQMTQFKSYQPRGWKDGKGQQYFTEDCGEGVCGNFKGFIQYRKMIEGENVETQLLK